MKIHFAGLPTAVDVRKLTDAFQNPRPGDEFRHEDIEQLLGLKRASSRYRTVTNAWRAQLLRHSNIHLDAMPSVGFKVLNSEERVNKGMAGVQHGMRKTIRSIKVADRVATDDPILQKKQDVMRRLGVAITSEANSLMKQIEPPKPTEQTPRVRRVS